jgi:hypothetical protein
MGACNFYETANGATVAEAFDNAHREASYQYGHDPYSGTIATKAAYIDCGPLPKGMTVDDVQQAFWDSLETYEYNPDTGRHELRPGAPLDDRLPLRWREAWEDKWGPCLAFATGDGEWTFIGHAPS